MMFCVSMVSSCAPSANQRELKSMPDSAPAATAEKNESTFAGSFPATAAQDAAMLSSINHDSGLACVAFTT